MKVTMLYFHTISRIIKKHGFTWSDVEGIQDHAQCLEDAFYITHMGGFDENSDRAKSLIKVFLGALKEAHR